jgi:hypothetical protein
MAQVSAFINTSRTRGTAFLKLMEDIVSLQTEYTALGGQTFINTFDFAGYDMTSAEYTAFLTALGQLITVYQNGSITANANRQRDLYKAKV